MKHSIAHHLDVATAREAADHAFAAYREQYGEFDPQASWVDDRRADISFRAKGVKLAGELLIEPTEIVLALDVPLLLRPFQKRAISTIDEEVRRWIAKAERGELKARD